MPNTIILAAATAATHSGGIVEKLGIEPKAIIVQMISFLILFAVLYKFGIKPAINTMAERQKKIADGLDYAEKMKAELAAAQARGEEIFRDASLKARQIMADAQQSAKTFADAQQKEAIEKAGDILAKARQAVELEHKKMLADARHEIARLVVATTERVLAKQLTDADRASYNEAASRELIKN
ncbi:MAG: F0F1 ATP synthase subunit B [Opitutaceae bacterium]|jgi:F-type H+-transporting ATPase subunit b|nr:F0F1 ATP synthase subunit B [Opitutaceae bacterium]